MLVVHGLYCNAQIYLGTGEEVGNNSYKEVGALIPYKENSDFLLRYRATSETRKVDVTLSKYLIHDGAYNLGVTGGLAIFDERRSVNVSLEPVVGIQNKLIVSKALDILVPIQYDIRGNYRGHVSVGVAVNIKTDSAND